MNLYTSLALAAMFLAPVESNSQAVQNEQKELDGSWALVSSEVNGKKLPDEESNSLTLVVKDGKATLQYDSKPVSVATMTLDPTKTPKRLDINVVSGQSEGKKSLAIYKLDGDKLTMCWTLFDVDRDRPTEFATKPGAGLLLVTYQRQERHLKDSDDLAKVQGTWQLKQAGGRHTVKVIKGNMTTLTRYDENGAVIHAHTSEFKLEVKDSVRIHTWSNLEVTEGPQKGQKSPEGLSFSYIYTVDKDTWVEARGLLVGQRDGQPRLHVWKRVSNEGVLGADKDHE
jgi:uncharacterized protein (TIGR03067 family)